MAMSPKLNDSYKKTFLNAYRITALILPDSFKYRVLTLLVEQQHLESELFSPP